MRGAADPCNTPHFVFFTSCGCRGDESPPLQMRSIDLLLSSDCVTLALDDVHHAVHQVIAEHLVLGLHHHPDDGFGAGLPDQNSAGVPQRGGHRGHRCLDIRVCLGGEQSGHIIFSRYASTGDGILTSLKVMEAMLAKKKTLSQLCEGFTFYPQVLKNVRVDDKAAAQNDPAVQKAIADVAAQLGSTGRILVRESGTEPVVRVMVEAESKVVCQDLVDSVIEVIKKTGHAV